MKLRPSNLYAEGLPDGDYTFTVVDGIGTWGSAGGALDDVLVTVVDGVPGLVFDGDGQIVLTEVPE